MLPHVTLSEPFRYSRTFPLNLKLRTVTQFVWVPCGIAKVRGSNPFKAGNFLQAVIALLLQLLHNCNDHILFNSFFAVNMNLLFSYIHIIYKCTCR